ncbi:hypothetical protein WDU94_003654 [Cyamophila willieti]
MIEATSKDARSKVSYNAFRMRDITRDKAHRATVARVQSQKFAIINVARDKGVVLQFTASPSSPRVHDPEGESCTWAVGGYRQAQNDALSTAKATSSAFTGANLVPGRPSNRTNAAPTARLDSVQTAYRELPVGRTGLTTSAVAEADAVQSALAMNRIKPEQGAQITHSDNTVASCTLNHAK